MALSVEAEVAAIDLETREVSLKGPDGAVFTLHSPERVVNAGTSHRAGHSVADRSGAQS
jgi:hypothetical protein